LALTVEQELETLIRARYPVINVVSWEEKRVEATIYRIAYERGKRPVKVWTVTQGFAKAGGQRDTQTLDPLAALDRERRIADL